MPELRVRVDAGLAAALAAEADRLGFDSRGAYVRWLLDRRPGGDADADADAGSEGGGRTDHGGPRAPSGTRAGGEGDSGSGRGVGDGAGPEAGGDGGGGRRRASADDGVEAAATAEGGLAVSVTPGRVTRPDDDGVDEAAARLGDVERDRLDAMRRRAGGAATDERPGSDLADLDALELPGRDGALVERRRRLVGAGVAYLREAGEASRSEFVADLRDDYPAGYDSVAGWWRCLSGGLRQVARVRAADADVRTWRYRDVRGRVHVVSDRE
jgi:hypothetical protein